MMFFNLNKHKSSFLALMLTLGLTLTGCSTDNSGIDSSSDSSTPKVDISSSSDSHASSVESELDINADYVIKATVDRVVDGDTVEIILPSGEEVDTRLLLIDTPETKHPNLGVQEYGPEASEFAKSVFQQGDTVYFELDSGDKTDRYGRYLGYLWYTCKEHNTLELYNERVVEEGLARVGYIYDQTKHLDALLATEEIAKANKQNIWSIDGYVTDKGFDMDKVKNPTVGNSSSSSSSSSSNSSSSSSSSSSTSTPTGGNYVYANTGSSSSDIYHKAKDSHGMKQSTKMTKTQAEKEGYRPCYSCFK